MGSKLVLSVLMLFITCLSFAQQQPRSTPASWEDVRVQKSETGHNLLQWSAPEGATDRFLIQRSENGQSFRAIGHITVHPRSPAAVYSFEDDGFKGNAYYRVIRIDAEGKVSYSTVAGLQPARKGDGAGN
jgi:fibronectin type 3 domain-containing protein